VTTVLLLQPSETHPPGPLRQWLHDGGVQLRIIRPFAGDAVPHGVAGVDAVVCLGGELDADDDQRGPWLPDIRALLAEAVRERVPVLAIGLGAQLLALATGGVVGVMAEGPEAGLRLVAKRDAAATDPLLADLPFTPDVVQFHRAEITRLPASATLLAVAPQCTNQAFRVGASAWGLQFHIETTPELLLQWMLAEPEVAAVMPASTEVDGVLEQGHQDVAETWEPIVRRFAELAGQPRGSGVGRARVDLPLLGDL